MFGDESVGTVRGTFLHTGHSRARLGTVPMNIIV